MDSKQFMDEVEKAYKRSVKVLLEKEKEYGEEGDRLAQFYRASRLRDVNPCEALIGMADKHYTSIARMVKKPAAFTLEEWNRKIIDLRNYTFLLDGLLRDRETHHG